MELTGKYSEEDLILLLQQQDEQAFAYLYNYYAPALNGVIFQLVEDKLLAEDILQEAFIKIWNNFSNYDKSRGRLFTWMINLTRNLTIDILRSKAYKDQAKISGNENSVNDMFDTRSTADRFDALGITKQLSNLKADHRIVINLAYFHGFTQCEIANEIGIPIGTVKTRMRTAILELRKILQPI